MVLLSSVMDRIVIERHLPKISTILTLTKINNSQKEMHYITRMRNMILFQISPVKDYSRLAKKFHHQIILERRNVALIQDCLKHAFSKVMKTSVLVHNSEPFRDWTTVIIDSVDNLQTGQMTAQTGGGNIGIAANDRFLVPTFLDLMTNDLLLFLNRRINTNIPRNILETTLNNRHLNPMHESTWRRLYDSNTTFFFCKYNDFILYVKEQTLESRPVNIFKEIMERQMGKAFDTTAILGKIASPYYYVLPHQDEQTYAIMELDRINRHYFIERRSSNYMTYRFNCELEVIMASFLFKVSK
ncbi:uncharacterized protein TNCT_313261 [Trichonephila clavata]|uniref:Uncharacterized protein n=1 Tax=Trichonephila clavata TaxID=2740835 RepID=A0A8X6H7T0_TRICU|nr:uncharacterized protein TNCT_313261 [Trichonephila clavata]